MNRRRFLTAREVQAMMKAVRHGQTGERDYCLILLAFRHGMRISELLNLHYRDFDLYEGRINIRRLKNGFSTIHPLMPDECEAIECWSRVSCGLERSAENKRGVYFPQRLTTFPPAGIPYNTFCWSKGRNQHHHTSAYAATCMWL
ncbi:tyrosine recombinase [Citrobacter koseri]|nr:tyrosine recombinase [Citrobacter koseri]